MRTRRRICLLAVHLAVLATVSPGTVSPGRGATPPPQPPSQSPSGPASLTLTSIGPDGRPLDTPSTQAVIAPDGRYVAFQDDSGIDDSGIYVRDIIGATTTLLSDPALGPATAPDISAGGRLVSYEQDGDVYVADRPAKLTRQVTGTGRDLPGEHVVPCPAGLRPGRVTPCGPRLSADGTTLVYPAELSAVSPELSVTVVAGDEDPAPLAGDLLDLGGFPSGLATVRYENSGRGPVRLTGVTVSGEAFELGQASCGGVLAPGGSCTATVGFDAEACQAPFAAGRLSTASPDPAGQTAVELIAPCQATQSQSDAHRPEEIGCPVPPGGLPLVPAPAMTSDNAGVPVTGLGSAEIGRPYLVGLPLSAPEAGSMVAFAGADCGIQLVDPARLKLAGPLPAGAPAACFEGERLASPAPPTPTPTPTTWTDARVSADLPASCTAYLLIDPGAVAPDAAFLGTVTCGCGQDAIPATYLAVQGVRHVIVARHDPGGTGNFAASASTVVSVTGQGAEVPGATEPSVSADGRYVGFAGWAGDPAGPSEVWLRDTGRTGSTTLVSPGADSPSVSGDGQRVAFATAGGPASGRVYVRSVRAQRTVLVSVGNGVSYAPAITRDGTVVAYLTRSPAPAGAASLYLVPASGGTSELAASSVPAIGAPSVDAIGRLAAFPATAALLPDAPPRVASVYTFDRPPRLTSSPARAGFGTVLVDSGSHALPVTVTDGGLGPGTVTRVTATGPFRVTDGTCSGAVLYGGGRCAVSVTFAPTAPGPAGGALTVTTQDDGEPPIAVTVPVAAAVPAPRLAASPGVASSGDAVLVTGTGFPPGGPVTLSWAPGLGSALAAPSGSGTFRAYLVIFPDDVTGPRALVATAAAGVLARTPFLVQLGSAEPPFKAGAIPP